MSTNMVILKRYMYQFYNKTDSFLYYICLSFFISQFLQVAVRKRKGGHYQTLKTGRILDKRCQIRYTCINQKCQYHGLHNLVGTGEDTKFAEYQYNLKAIG
ncbi:hypothetical protein VNO77_24000 [Canavalia gladiata]|uniref:Uncharacterized protein n=1 Tax=Canavalia gladiata TaxID=3824 RepID=A0AAN9L5F2_CANGL